MLLKVICLLGFLAFLGYKRCNSPNSCGTLANSGKKGPFFLESWNPEQEGYLHDYLVQHFAFTCEGTEKQIYSHLLKNTQVILTGVFKGWLFCGSIFQLASSHSHSGMQILEGQ